MKEVMCLSCKSYTGTCDYTRRRYLHDLILWLVYFVTRTHSNGFRDLFVGYPEEKRERQTDRQGRQTDRQTDRQKQNKVAFPYIEEQMLQCLLFCQVESQT